MRPLLQGTTVIMVGPICDTDGQAVTGATLSTAKVYLSKNHAAFAAKACTEASSYSTHGQYRIFISTVDSGTLGQLRMSIETTESILAWEDFEVMNANTYNSIFAGTDYLQIDMVQNQGAGSTVLTTGDLDAAIVGVSTLATADLDAAVSGYGTLSTADLDAAFAAYGPSTHTATDVLTQSNAAFAAYGPSTHTATDILTQANAAFASYGPSTHTATDILTQANAAFATYGPSTHTATDVLTQANAAFAAYGPSTHTATDVLTQAKAALTTYGLNAAEANITSEINYNSVKKGSSFEFDIMMIKSTDHRSALTGATLSVAITLDGSTWAAFAGSVTETGYGVYHVMLDTADVNANFSGSYRFTAAGGDARVVALKIAP